ncbi:alpha/beta hydrolase [Rhodococcus qingshengii]|uniref:alpha/beta hydrolase n=1 Tax=Rhodococcus qingshengii TaxID=334542 RepID=UPI0035576BBE
MFDIDRFTTGPFHDQCEGWPAPPSRDSDWLPDVHDLPQALVVAVTDDPGTPYEGNVAMADELDSHLMTAKGGWGLPRLRMLLSVSSGDRKLSLQPVAVA